jgi:hypothetical protein
MTTIIPFLPSNLRAPQFSLTLDGSPYKLVVTWNISALRYYINIYDISGNWIITVPLLTTPPSRQISSVAFNPFLDIVTVKLVDPAAWPIPLSPGGIVMKPGTMVDYTLENFTPDTYNGLFRALQINTTTFSIPMASDPGPASILGTAARYINMVSGVFTTSTLIYRNGAFEVNP